MMKLIKALTLTGIVALLSLSYAAKSNNEPQRQLSNNNDANFLNCAPNNDLFIRMHNLFNIGCKNSCLFIVM